MTNLVYSEISKDICPLCDGAFPIKEWYRICEHCKIIRPKSKEQLDKEIESILRLRHELRDHLHEIVQKSISNPESMIKKEKEEYKLWWRHNDLYVELEFLMPAYSKKEIRFSYIYPLLYSYVKTIEEIKEFYQ